MEILSLSTLVGPRLDVLLRRSAALIADDSALEGARRVLQEVRARGDEVLVEYTKRWDGVMLSPETLTVSGDEIEEAYRLVDDSVRSALQTAIDRTRAFHERLRPRQWLEQDDGRSIGVRITPVAAVGVYVPSGKGRFPSIAVTLITPAVVAGVPQINVLVPPRKDGSVDPALLVVADLLGIRRIFRCNGVAGVAALAVGTGTIPAVPVMVGPGNPHVIAVQMAAQALGTRVPAILGPTEAMVLADDQADPRRIALDLVNEAEHGTDSAAVLVTTSRRVAEAVRDELAELLERLPEARRQFAHAALTEYGGIILADSMAEALAFVNRYAPEHLQLAVRDPLAALTQIEHAGEILLGQDTPFSAATYAMGLPAALPTGGSARSSGAITVLSFLKVSSVGRLDAEGLAAARMVVEALGTYEGFPAHVMAVTDRR